MAPPEAANGHPPPRVRPKRCCLVIGMHNSGTSLAGALLHAARVPMGDRLLLRETISEPLRPRYDYFEDHDVVQLQDAALLDLKRHWSSYRASWSVDRNHSTNQAICNRLKHELRRIVQRRLHRSRLWVMKDPRTAILLPEWLEVLHGLQVEPLLLLVHRDPSANIRSFSSKGQVPGMWAEALWQRTYRAALEGAAGLPSASVHCSSFEALSNQPLAEIQGICRFLGHAPAADLEARLAQAVDGSLPLFQAGDGSDLAPATQALSRRLAGEIGVPMPAEAVLLATTLERAVASAPAGLALNGLHPEGQTLQPKSRVAIITGELQGYGASGGIGTAYAELAQLLADSGHAVDVLLVGGAADANGPPLRGVRVEPIPWDGLTRVEMARRLRNRLLAWSGDVVHVADWLGLGSGLKAALEEQGTWILCGLHGPSAWTRSGNPWPRNGDSGLDVAPEALYEEGLIMALEEDTLRHADLLVSPSNAMATWVRDHIAVDGGPRGARPLVVQRNCPSRTRLAVAAGGGSEPHSLVYFGRLEERKGLLLFLEALAQMPRRPEQVHFLGGDCRIGERSQGSELAAARLAQLGLPAHFHLHCPREEALALLASLGAVVVLPSLIENSPYALEELLGSGLRIVATAVGGNAELVLPEGAVLAAPTPESLAAHLQEALHGPQPERYVLEAAVPDWQRSLSWLAFHERLPRRRDAAATSGTWPTLPLTRRERWLQRGRRLASRAKRSLTSRLGLARDID